MEEEKAIARLESPDNLINKLSKDKTEIEKNKNIQIEELYKNRMGPKGIPPMIQTLAIETATVTNERAAAQEWGIAHQTVNYYKNGGGKADREHVKETIGKAHSNALDVMLGSIGLLKEKIDNKQVHKATDLSKIAADMGRVIEKTTPKEHGAANVKILVFAPNMKAEDDYEEMVVNG